MEKVVTVSSNTLKPVSYTHLANGCGKSTVLKTIARIIQPKSGDIYINDKNIKEQSSKDLAKTMAVLPQSPQAPSGLTVEELIAYGRFPHQKGFGKLKKEDTDIVTWALEVTGIEEFRDRDVYKRQYV